MHRGEPRLDLSRSTLVRAAAAHGASPRPLSPGPVMRNPRARKTRGIVYVPDFFDELKAKMAEAGQ